MYPGPVLIQQGARKCTILSCLLVKLKDVVFLCLVIFIVVQNDWLATDSQNAILNNFEEYCMFDVLDLCDERRDLKKKRYEAE